MANLYTLTTHATIDIINGIHFTNIGRYPDTCLIGIYLFIFFWGGVDIDQHMRCTVP